MKSPKAVIAGLDQGRANEAWKTGHSKAGFGCLGGAIVKRAFVSVCHKGVLCSTGRCKVTLLNV